MMQRRTFLATSAAALLMPSLARARAPRLDVVELSLEEISGRMSTGSLSSRSLVDAYLGRIERLDRAGPTLRSVLETNPDARRIASTLDEERRAGKARGPLHGVPILVKDNIDTLDPMKTTAGSLALLDAPRPAKDAVVVERLRSAGCVILGKTNLSEWANMRGDRSSSGWSARGGQARNPYALDRNPCGSSSGSGVAVAASLCAAAIGTETLGSIQCPASINGISGIKPTVGLLPTTGIVPISHSMDTAGPMARSVADAAMVMRALAPDLALDLSQGVAAMKGARIGVPRALWGNDDRMLALLAAAVTAMRGAGAEIIDVEIEDGSAYLPACLTLLQFEMKADLGTYFEARGGPMRSLEDLIRFNTAQKDQELALFGQEVFIASSHRGDLTSAEYRASVSKLENAQKEVAALFAKHKLDAMFDAGSGLPWLTDHVRGDKGDAIGTMLPTIAGGPVVVVQAGLIGGLPFGVVFEGVRGSDARTIALAHAFEKLTQLRRPPTYAPTLGT